jgi:hypothetical protein
VTGADTTTAGRRDAGRRVPRGSWLAAAGLTLVLAAFGGRYGYHRDELYFVAAGGRPAWGYPDQPPLVPLLAAGWDTVVRGELWAFRLVPAVLAGLIVVVASLTSAAMGTCSRRPRSTSSAQRRRCCSSSARCRRAGCSPGSGWVSPRA